MLITWSQIRQFRLHWTAGRANPANSEHEQLVAIHHASATNGSLALRSATHLFIAEAEIKAWPHENSHISVFAIWPELGRDSRHLQALGPSILYFGARHTHAPRLPAHFGNYNFEQWPRSDSSTTLRTGSVAWYRLLRFRIDRKDDTTCSGFGLVETYRQHAMPNQAAGDMSTPFKLIHFDINFGARDKDGGQGSNAHALSMEAETPRDTKAFLESQLDHIDKFYNLFGRRALLSKPSIPLASILQSWLSTLR